MRVRVRVITRHHSIHSSQILGRTQDAPDHQYGCRNLHHDKIPQPVECRVHEHSPRSRRVAAQAGVQAAARGEEHAQSEELREQADQHDDLAQGHLAVPLRSRLLLVLCYLPTAPLILTYSNTILVAP